MATFRRRLAGAKKTSDRRVILACDYSVPSGMEYTGIKPYKTGTGYRDTGNARASGTAYKTAATSLLRIIRDIKKMSPFLCAVKLNYHLLLPLGAKQVAKVTNAAHESGLQAIADVKLNDIGNTNKVATDILWDMGFDAVIANPIMGLDGIKNLVWSAHKKQKGVITLCHMSAPEARMSYEMNAFAPPQSKSPKAIHRIFLDWALDSGADGIIVGATFPDMVRDCSRRIALWEKRHRARQGPLIISPGVGAQGADAADTICAGSDYVIAGRSIIHSKDPASAARLLYRQTCGLEI